MIVVDRWIIRYGTQQRKKSNYRIVTAFMANKEYRQERVKKSRGALGVDLRIQKFLWALSCANKCFNYFFVTV
jgi:hypothetical protein